MIQCDEQEEKEEIDEEIEDEEFIDEVQTKMISVLHGFLFLFTITVLCALNLVYFGSKIFFEGNVLGCVFMYHFMNFSAIKRVL